MLLISLLLFLFHYWFIPVRKKVRNELTLCNYMIATNLRIMILQNSRASLPAPGTKEADKNVLLNLTQEGEFTLTENSAVVTEGNWQLRVADIDYSEPDSDKPDIYLFKLDLNNPSIYLYGRIILCEDKVLFNNSYIDGVDNLFIRTDH